MPDETPNQKSTPEPEQPESTPTNNPEQSPPGQPVVQSSQPADPPTQPTVAKYKKPLHLNLALDPRFIIIILVLVIAGMGILWKLKSSDTSANARTVTVTGSATIKAKPDEFVFSPQYDLKNADKNTALAESQKKQTELVAGLKKIGVTDDQIKIDTNGNEDYNYTTTGSTSGNGYVYTIYLTVTVPSKDKAQQIQNYLNTTGPTGTITPYAQFSKATEKQLENKARDQASADARSKADKSAKALGFKISKVKSVDDGGFGAIGCGGGACGVELNTSGGAAMGVEGDVAAPNLQPGLSDYDYTVTVTYFIK